MPDTPADYTFTIRNDKIRSYNRIGYLLIIINILFLLLVAIKANIDAVKRYALIGGLLTLFWVLLGFLRSYGDHNSRMRLLPGYLFPAFIWFQLSWYGVTIALVVLAVLDYLARRPLILRCYSDGMLYPSLPEKKILWTELENVVLKDGLLTIDYKDNTMRQVNIDEDVAEEVFNAYAAERLGMAG